MDWVKEKMQQARLHRTQLQKQEHFDAPDLLLNNSKELTTNRSAQSYNSRQKLVWLATGLISGAIIVSLVWWANSIDLGTGTEIDRLKSNVSLRVQEPVEHKAEHPDTDSRSEQRSDAIQASTVSELGILPPPATGKTNRHTLAGSENDNSSTATGGGLQTNVTQRTVDAKMRPQETNKDSETWVINLVSLQGRVDAEKFAAKAISKGVATEIDQVVVRGKTYWRVQVPGFSSADEARTNINEVEEKLGLKNVWVVKR
jgi:cell division septation protein DedD